MKLLLLFGLLYCQYISAQSYQSRWQYSWGGNRQDMLNVMIPMPGNKYLFAGTAASDPSCTKIATLYGDEDFAIVEFDDAGNKLWEKTYGGDRWDQLAGAIKVSTGGFILVGLTESGPSGIKTSPLIGMDDIWVVRIDDNGNLLWEKTYGRADFEGGASIIETPDGGFLIAGLSLSNTPNYNFGRSDYLLMKIDANGNEIWTKLYGGTDSDELYGFVALSDGNYFLCGTSSSPVSGNKTSSPIGGMDIWLVKVTPDGTKMWDKSFGTSADDFRGRLTSLSDNNVLMVESAAMTGRLRKIDINGNQIWLTTCSGNNQDFFEFATEDTATGNIYVGGSSKTDNFGCKTSPYNGGGWFGDIWIPVFDAMGNKIDDMDYGGNDADVPMDIDILNDEIWITAWSDSPLSGNKTTNNCGQTADGWIIRLAKNFYINNQTPSALCNSQNTMKVHFTTTTNYNVGNVFTVQLSDANGNFSSPFNIGSVGAIKSDSINVTLPPGLPASSNYKLRIIATLPADTTSSYPFWLHGAPVVNLGNDTLICQNTNITLNAGLQPPGSQIIWSTGNTNSSVNISGAGIYWCEVQTTGCGIDRDSVNVQVKLKPITIIGPDTSFCAGETISLQSNPQLPDASYLWSTGSISNSIAIQNSGLYWLNVSNACGSSADSLVATKLSLPTINLNKDDFLCVGSSRLLDAGIGFKNYLWNTGDNSSAISINTTGVYSVVVIDGTGCKGTDTTIITKMISLPAAFLPADTAICEYEDVVLRSNNNFSSYLWSTGAGSSSILVKQPATYWLEVKNSYGCIGKDSIVINSKDCPTGFYMPTGFTPNNDSKNDICRPILFGEVTQYHFVLYNKWGQKIYESKNRNEGWDGRLKGSIQKTDIFIWTCNYQFKGEEVRFKKGTVVLIR